ncbi:MAG: ferritin-like domain-containing protein [Bryobacteraceae bacterium]|nr:ferritin-like domain-containing protein [Bryobacteraceae bacterium]
MELTSMQTLLVHELRDLYDAENQLVMALPKMAEAATNLDLKEAFRTHLQETTNQIARLNRVFQALGIPPNGTRCEAMEGLIAEGEKIVRVPGDPDVKDAALIAAAQRVEHYEISAYGSARAHAKLLEFDDAADLLKDSLTEESKADEKLNKIAEGGLFTSGVNQEATKTW